MIINASGSAGLNFKVVGGTTQPANPKENTIWVSADVEIAEWGFGTENPFEKDLAAGVETAQGFIYGDGSIGDTSVHYVDYTVDFIPVDTSKKYRWAYSLSSSNVMAFRVVEYDENKNLLAVATPVSEETGISQSGSYIFANDSTKYIRLTYYGWDDPGCKVEFIENAAAEGAVWIQTGSRSAAPFNALKKDALTVYPIKCAQYVGGAWVEKDAKTYQNGAWKSWLLTLKLFPVSTGVPWSYSAQSGSSVTIADTYIYFPDDNYYNGAFTTDYIDLSGFKTLYISTNFSSLYSGGIHRMGVRTNKYSASNYADVSTYIASATPTTGSKTVAIDISNVAGGYITVQGAIRGYAYEVWAE